MAIFKPQPQRSEEEILLSLEEVLREHGFNTIPDSIGGLHDAIVYFENLTIMRRGNYSDVIYVLRNMIERAQWQQQVKREKKAQLEAERRKTRRLNIEYRRPINRARLGTVHRKSSNRAWSD